MAPPPRTLLRDIIRYRDTTSRPFAPHHLSTTTILLKYVLTTLVRRPLTLREQAGLKKPDAPRKPPSTTCSGPEAVQCSFQRKHESASFSCAIFVTSHAVDRVRWACNLFERLTFCGGRKVEGRGRRGRKFCSACQDLHMRW